MICNFRYGIILKTYLYYFDPPPYSLEPPRENRFVEAVLMSTYNLCFEQKYEKYQHFSLKMFIFLVVKFSLYLNRRVFVMYVRLGEFVNCSPSIQVK